MQTVLNAAVTTVPVAVVDVETTGLHPRGDRIIEIAVVRIETDGRATTVVDTLVNPRRPVSATEIHGITDDDVADAPTFDEIAPAVAEALNGAVFASFNVYFDSRFVAAELTRSMRGFPPHVCLMYLRPGLGLGQRATLADTCAAHGVPHSHTHCAADDAEASARLWYIYLDRMRELQIHTFADLGRHLSYKFTRSFDDPLLQVARLDACSPRFKSRRGKEGSSTAVANAFANPIAEYWEALKAVVADFNVTSSEVEYLAAKKAALGLSNVNVRAMHARAFSGLLAQLADDYAVDDDEVGKIAMFAEALRTLGWAPGDRVLPTPRPGLLRTLLRR